MSDTRYSSWFEKVYHENFERLFRYAFSILGQKDAAEDVVSEVFMHFWDKREEITEIEDIVPYLLRSVRNLSINQKKRNNFSKYDSIIIGEELPFSNGLNPELILLGNELEEIVKAICKDLPPHGLLVYEMARKKGYSKKEIAAELGITIRTVNKHLNNVLCQFRKALESRYRKTDNHHFFISKIGVITALSFHMLLKLILT
ncbi:MAG: sigma-70 family RNA polymerase sigma factor [Marinoscillum sp.]